MPQFKSLCWEYTRLRKGEELIFWVLAKIMEAVCCREALTRAKKISWRFSGDILGMFL